MSHIHIPDGVLPLWLVAIGWLVTATLLAVALRGLKENVTMRLPLLGVMSALMVVAMNVEIAPIAYHINLTVLSGIILGPALGLLAAFLVNVVLALMGHGGITVAGLNTLLLGTEVVAGWALYRLASRAVARPGLAAGVATWVSLLLSALAMIGIVALSNIDVGPLTPHGALEPQTLQFRDPFGDGVLRIELGAAEHEDTAPGLGLWAFARLVLILGSIGWTLEAFVTGTIAGYLSKVAPHLIEGKVAFSQSQG